MQNPAANEKKFTWTTHAHKQYLKRFLLETNSIEAVEKETRDIIRKAKIKPNSRTTKNRVALKNRNDVFILEKVESKFVVITYYWQE